MAVRLRQWSIVASVIQNGDGSLIGYLAPERIPQRRRLKGRVYGHPNPRHPDGKEVVTSSIVGVRGRLVTTSNGTEYLLEGAPDPKYEQFCIEKGYSINRDSPVTQTMRKE